MKHKDQPEPIFEHNVTEPGFRIVKKGSTANGYTLSNGARHLIVRRESPATVSVRPKVYRRPNAPEANDEIVLTNEEFLTAFGAAGRYLVTDPEFAHEMGADVGIRDKFARKGEITNFYYRVDGAQYWVSIETTATQKVKAQRFIAAGAAIRK